MPKLLSYRNELSLRGHMQACPSQPTLRAAMAQPEHVPNYEIFCGLPRFRCDCPDIAAQSHLTRNYLTVGRKGTNRIETTTSRQALEESDFRKNIKAIAFDIFGSKSIFGFYFNDVQLQPFRKQPITVAFAR